MIKNLKIKYMGDDDDDDDIMDSIYSDDIENMENFSIYSEDKQRD